MSQFLTNPFLFAAAGGGGVTWNPADKGALAVLSSGNLTWTVTNGASGIGGCRATTSKSSGKWYIEFLINNTTLHPYTHPGIGFVHSTFNLASLPGLLAGQDNSGFLIGRSNSYAFSKGAQIGTTYGAWANGDRLMLAVDFAASKMWAGKNGTWLNSGNPAAGTGAVVTDLTGTLFPYTVATGEASGPASATIKPGAADFAYSVPSGFSAWG